MADLTDEHRRALNLLARSPDGRAEAALLTHGFNVTMLDQLVVDGLTKAETYDLTADGRPVKVVWVRITEAGRKAIEE